MLSRTIASGGPNSCTRHARMEERARPSDRLSTRVVAISDSFHSNVSHIPISWCVWTVHPLELRLRPASRQVGQEGKVTTRSARPRCTPNPRACVRPAKCGVVLSNVVEVNCAECRRRLLQG